MGSLSTRFPPGHEPDDLNFGEGHESARQDPVPHDPPRHESAQARPVIRRRSWLRPAVVEYVLMGVDATLIVGCGILSSYAYRWHASAPVPLEPYAAAAAVVAANFVLLLALQKSYRLQSMAGQLRQIHRSFVTWTGVIAALVSAGFVMKVSQEFSRGAIVLFYIGGSIAITSCRIVTAIMITRALRDGKLSNSRVVVVAERGMAASSAALQQLRRHGYRPAKILELSGPELLSPMTAQATRSRINALIGYCRENKIEKVFMLLSWNRQQVIEDVIEALRVLPIPVHLIPDASVSRFLKYRVVEEGDTWTMELRPAPLSFGQRSFKRAFDLTGALSAMVLFAPIMITAAVLIKLDSSGPVLFRQTRHGFNGRNFRIFKFRTMKVAEDGPLVVQATRGDTRITRIGRWLRKTSIDELPQILNVIQGDMALVGPRPHAAAHNVEYERVIGTYAFRHQVKPGITGWAQVNGYRGETNAIGLMERRVELDLWYINNWSLWLDVSIVIKTAIASFRTADVY